MIDGHVLYKDDRDTYIDGPDGEIIVITKVVCWCGCPDATMVRECGATMGTFIGCPECDTMNGDD